MLITVAIPTYNRSELIGRAIESVISQTYTNWELIVCDDASTDNTEEIVAGYDDERIRMVRNHYNKGNAGARNLGWKHAQGEYISYLDSDDELHPEFLTEMASIILMHNPDFLWSNVMRIDLDGNEHPNVFPRGWDPTTLEDPYHNFLKGLNFGTDFGFTVRQVSIEKLGGFDENLRVSVDTDFILRAVQSCRFSYTNRILVNNYDHEGPRVRRDKSKKAEAYAILFEKHKVKIESDVELKKKWYYKMMWLNYEADNKKEARRFLKKNIKESNLKAMVAGLIFEILPESLAAKMHVTISKQKKSLKLK